MGKRRRAIPSRNGLTSSALVAMVLNAHTDPVTEEQRKELKRLCDAAGVPDKSGELLTHSGAQQMIEELRRKAAEQQ
jgi:hypothetical protein